MRTSLARGSSVDVISLGVRFRPAVGATASGLRSLAGAASLRQEGDDLFFQHLLVARAIAHGGLDDLAVLRNQERGGVVAHVVLVADLPLRIDDDRELPAARLH